MARRVPPWLWAVLIRDKGPNDSTMRLCLHTLRTFMDSSGSAFPSQATLAKAACISENAMQKKLKQAEQLHWLGVYTAGRNGKGWKRYEYVACVPDSVEIPEQHEHLADTWASQHGEVETRAIVPFVNGDVQASGKPQTTSSPSSRENVPILTALRPHPDANIVPIQDGTKSSFLSSQGSVLREGRASTPSSQKNSFAKENPEETPGFTHNAKLKPSRKLPTLTDKELFNKVEALSSVTEDKNQILRQLQSNFADISVDRIVRVILQFERPSIVA